MTTRVTPQQERTVGMKRKTPHDAARVPPTAHGGSNAVRLAWRLLSDSSSASARSDARRRRCFARRPGVPMAGIPLLDLGEFSSATSGSLTVALRAAASEPRGHGVCCCRPARASAGTDGLVRHRCSSWRSDAVAQRPVAPLGLPVRVDFWSAGRIKRWRPRDGTAAGSPEEHSAGRVESAPLAQIQHSGALPPKPRSDGEPGASLRALSNLVPQRKPYGDDG